MVREALLWTRPNGDPVLQIEMDPEDWGESGRVFMRREGVAVSDGEQVVALLDGLHDELLGRFEELGTVSVMIGTEEKFPVLNHCRVVPA